MCHCRYHIEYENTIDNACNPSNQTTQNIKCVQYQVCPNSNIYVEHVFDNPVDIKKALSVYKFEHIPHNFIRINGDVVDKENISYKFIDTAIVKEYNFVNSTQYNYTSFYMKMLKIFTISTIDYYKSINMCENVYMVRVKLT